MNKKALLKTALCMGGFIGYLALVVIACVSNSPVFIGAVLGPLVIIAFVCTGKELYDYFND